MKIVEISIKLAPSSGQETHNPVTIIRSEDKIWTALETVEAKVDDGFGERIETFQRPRGLYPYEVKLISMIQVEVIEKFNGTQK